MENTILSKARVKMIRSLHTNKGRQKSGLCLVEGAKVIETAGDAVDFTFTREDAFDDIEFNSLVTTETPQEVAAVARIPEWTNEQLEAAPVMVVLDGVQDPGNVGSLLRLCLAFDASLLLIESVDVTNPKVIRSSVGALFQVPWRSLPRNHAESYLTALGRPVYKLERTDASTTMLHSTSFKAPFVLVAGSEGNGITIKLEGESVAIEHKDGLESLNVTHAVAIALHQAFTQ